MAIQLDLNKDAATVKKEAGDKLILDLKKVGMDRKTAKSRVVLVLDRSGSTNDMYKRKAGNKSIFDALATRAAGVALNLDDNGELDIIVFDSKLLRDLPTLTERNIDGYVDKMVATLGGGGTNYAPPLRKLQTAYGVGDPVFVIFITDGENYDEADARQALIDLSYHGPIFVQFVGISMDGRTRFPFLEEVNNMSGRFMDNAGFCTVNLGSATDAELLDALLNEYPQFLAMCQQKGYLPWQKAPLAQAPRRR